MKEYGARIRLSEEEVEHIFARRQGFVAPPTHGKAPKVLVFDLETAPIAAYVWDLWKDTSGVQGVVNDWFAICWAAKWLFNDKILSDCVTPQEAIEEDDSNIMASLWKLIDEADILIGHNINRFDCKRINTRFIVHGLQPPSPYQTIDTLVAAKKHFSFSSNKLDYINEQLGIGRKVDTGGFKLWKRCLAGDPKALDDMLKYCEVDVGISEETYVALRPWIKSHPNMGLYVDTDVPVCPTCGDENLISVGKYRTTVSEFMAFRCAACGAIGRYTSGSRKKFKIRTQSVAR